jgi:predicted metalloprotease
MRWQDADRSTNVDDVRGRRFGGGGMPVRIGGIGGMGLGGLVAIMAITYLLGGDPLAVLTGGVPTETAAPPSTEGAAPVDDEGSRFVRAVLKSTEDVWGQVFRAQLGRDYAQPRLVLFTDAVPSACGTNSSAVGPFYCPPDQRVYIDLSFYQELDRRFGAPGDFAQAYVIAHEVGHHVQNLLGIDDRVRAAQQRASEQQANQLSVRMELQADCLAGVWGHFVKAETAANKVRLEPGDVEEGMRAAAAIGDDAIQRKAQGRVSPESWTHGSSEQRVQWLRRGLESGQVSTCDTLGST